MGALGRPLPSRRCPRSTHCLYQGGLPALGTSWQPNCALRVPVGRPTAPMCFKVYPCLSAYQNFLCFYDRVWTCPFPCVVSSAHGGWGCRCLGPLCLLCSVPACENPTPVPGGAIWVTTASASQRRSWSPGGAGGCRERGAPAGPPAECRLRGLRDSGCSVHCVPGSRTVLMCHESPCTGRVTDLRAPLDPSSRTFY